MVNQRQRLFLGCAFIFCLMGISLFGCTEPAPEPDQQTTLQEAQPAPDQKTSLEDVQKEAGEAAQAAKQYAEAQKDKFMEEAKTAMEEMDQKISELKTEMEKKWNEMDQEARQQAEKALEAMKENREELSKKLKALKDGSAEAWEKLKNDFWETYESFKESTQSPKEEGVSYI